nr:glycosyltransferase family 2 protein [Flavobacterium sp.]
MSDLVSIIIPTFNRANLLAETLDSIIQQTHTNWECIIVDDGSTDNISDIIEKYVSTDSRFRFYKRPSDRPKGANACRNYGFEMSKGDFINWFDSDDIMSLHHIEEHLRVHATTHVDATISLASVFTHSPDMTVRMWSAIAPREDVVSEMIAGVISWPINNVIWRRKSLPVCPFS